MTCPQCRTDNPPGLSSCDNCGYIFSNAGSKELGTSVAVRPVAVGNGASSPDSTATSYTAASAPSRIICLNCKTSSSPNATYCNYCQELLPLQPGATLGQGRFKIERVLGQGGMGRVYLATDSRTNTQVVVKEVLDEQGRPQHERQIYLEHFENEAAVLGLLTQVRSVPLLLQSVTAEGARHYFVMEYIDGSDLSELVEQQRRPLAPATAVNYAIRVCEVLEIIHRRQPPIVHRDIKPENLRLRKSDGSIALLDFGIARNVRVGTRLTSKLGTRGYVAPEQHAGQAEPRSDLYSLAATMFFLLSMQVPDDDMARRPGSLRQLNSQVSPDLEEMILANLSLQPHDRYESAGDFARDLAQGRMTRTNICTNCGTTNDRRLIYCRTCATPLSNQARQCVQCRNFIPLRAAFCPHCGRRA